MNYEFANPGRPPINSDLRNHIREMQASNIGWGAPASARPVQHACHEPLVLPFDFAKIIWSASLGYWFFGEYVSVYTLAGGAIIFGGACYVAIREHQLEKALQDQMPKSIDVAN